MKLKKEFLQKYQGQEPFNSLASKLTAYRTYSRFLDDQGRREKWPEIIQRVTEYSMWLDRSNISEAESQQELENMFDANFNMRWLPAGRTLWSGGTKHSYEIGGLSQFNCSFVSMDSLVKFKEMVIALSLGVGVGFSVESKYIDKLPDFHKNKIVVLPYEWAGYNSPDYKDGKRALVKCTEDEIFVTIPDSKEGWATGVQVVLSSLCKNVGKTIYVNLNSLRPEGERIKGFGGKSSGPEPYKGLMELLDRMIAKKESNTFRLSSVDVLDICNAIAYIVVAGGVRRSAQICLADADDNGIETAKLNYFMNPDTKHRGMSNNSLHFYTKPTLDRLLSLANSIKNSWEPGLYNAEAASKRRPRYSGVNPCCVLGNTRILTNEGYKNIDSVVGKDISIWNGKEWSIVTPYYSGFHDTVIVKLSDGVELRCTPNHKFVLKGGQKVEADDLKPGDKLEKFAMPFVDALQKDDPKVDAYSQGFYSGDGNSGYELSWIYEPKYMCADRLIGKIGETTKYGRKSWTHGPMLDKGFVPINASINYKVNWLSGLLDADGCALDSPNSTVLQLASVDKQFLLDLKLLLTTLGCTSKVVFAADEQMRSMPDGRGGHKEYLCKAANRILINSNQLKTLIGLGLKTERLDISKCDPNRDASRFVKVVSVEESEPGDVYCFTDVLNGTGTFEGIVTGNSEILLDDRGVCNLVTVVVSRHMIQDESGFKLDLNALEKSFREATRHAVRVTNTDIEIAEWDEVQKRDRLVGVSMTGAEDAFDACDTGEHGNSMYDTRLINTNIGKITVDVFKKLANSWANSEAIVYSAKMDIPSPVLVTAIKPEGTLSLIAGVSAGCHKSFAPYYFRRIRINRFDALAEAAVKMGIKAYPEVGQGPSEFTEAKWDALSEFEKDYWLKNCNTWVLEIPVKSPAKFTSQDESALSQLNRYYSYQHYYSDHQTSITITVDENEWDPLFRKIYDKWDLFIGISFQAKENGQYELAPYKPITEEQFEQSLSRIKTDLDMYDLLVQIEAGESKADDDLGADCSGGACPIR